MTEDSGHDAEPTRHRRPALDRWLDQLGRGVLEVVTETGRLVLFLGRSLYLGVRPPLRLRLVFEQAEFVGVGSLFIVVLTGAFTGAVFTLQSVGALRRVGMESMVGSTVMIAVARELAPVLTSLMVSGRVGSAFATELGTMRVSEQIDAMEVMAVDPIDYLVSPRLIACSLMVPCLSLLFLLVAGGGSYLVAVPLMGIDEGAYLARIRWYLDPYDITHGIYKAFVFGVIIALVGCYKGFFASGGARGVGSATTQAVVIGSILVFVLDYVLTALIMIFEPDAY